MTYSKYAFYLNHLGHKASFEDKLASAASPGLTAALLAH